MRALVTGATGFVGSHLVARLVGRGDEVAILRRAESDPWRVRHLLPGVTQIRGGFPDVDGLARPIAEFAPDVVFHLAWGGVGKAQRDDPHQHRVNIDGSLALLRLAACAGCGTWVGLGSQAEYGPRDGPLDEDAPTSPRNHYGAAKVEVCTRSRALAADLGVRSVWLRLFSAYGPADSPSALIPYLVTTLLGGGRPALTAGTQLWDYLYVADAAEAIIAAAATPGAEGVFNLGSGRVCTIREVAGRIRDRIDPALPLGFGEVPLGPDPILHLQADIGRLTRSTGWTPRTGLDEGLARTVDWHRRHGPGPRADAHAGSPRASTSRPPKIPVEIDR
jgi:UDP-glucose 4-epimerase